MGLLKKHEMPILWGAIDKAELAKKYSNPYRHDDLAFLLCVERVEWWFNKSARDEAGILIADETEPKDEKQHKKSLRYYRRVQIPWSQSKLTHIIDSIHFVSSEETWGVQLADVCNFFIKRHLMAKLDSEHFFKMFAAQIVYGKLFPPKGDSFSVLYCEDCKAEHPF